MTDEESTFVESFRDFLVTLGEDPKRDGLRETPERFVRQLKQSLSGYEDHYKTHIKVFDSEGFEDLIMVKNISFSSMCEHHVVPFFGSVNFAYVPSNKILGLSKFARIVDSVSRRLQVQERLAKELADILEENLKPKLLIIDISAKHLCMVSRGVRRTNSITNTFIIRGNEEGYKSYIKQFKDVIKHEPNNN